MRFRALRGTPGGIWDKDFLTLENENSRIPTFWPGQSPAGPGPDRTEPRDAFESTVSDFEIRLMNEMLRYGRWRRIATDGGGLRLMVANYGRWWRITADGGELRPMAANYG